ncbi:MAG: sigma-70 family RNA polymerase sigma factor [Steroidobacteraceae bacterium]
MRAPQQSDEDTRDKTSRTLGDLLCTAKGTTPVSEREWVALVHSIGAGDQLALRALYELTNRLVFTLTMRITNNRETAEELTLDVFHDVWRRAAGYDPAGGSVVGWIMNQARSRAIDRLRFEQRKKRVISVAVDPLAPQAAGGSDEAIELSQQHQVLRTALTALTPDERGAIETSFFSELTYAETAQRLKQPLGTIKTRIRAGLQKLRRALGRNL